MKKRVEIRGSRDVLQLLKPYWKKRQEHFLVITLDACKQVIKTHVVTIGLANLTLTHPREVFFPAIKDNATAIIIAHNHPSGVLTPSEADETMTHRLKTASEILGITILDHVIIAGHDKPELFSFLDAGIL